MSDYLERTRRQTIPMLRMLFGEPWFEEVDSYLIYMALTVAIQAVLARHHSEDARQKLAMAGSGTVEVYQWLHQHHEGFYAHGQGQRAPEVLQ